MTRIAAVQAAPVLLDREATLARVDELTGEAAAGGADLVVFPEAFVPGYPDWVWRTTPWDGNHTRLTTLLLEQAVAVPGPACDALAAVAARHRVHLGVGVDEREPQGATIFNTALLFGPDGALLLRHRKLMPTGGERLVWGMGDGSTLEVVPTPLGRIGALICWENYMPLARAALYAQGLDILLAPTWDNSDVWVPTMRHVAKEGRCVVVGVNHCIRGSDVPESLPGRDELYHGDGDWLSRGNSVIVGPEGELLAGPLVESCGLVVADVDVAAVREARTRFDPVGHYARADVLRLVVDRRRMDAVRFVETAAAEDAPV